MVETVATPPPPLSKDDPDDQICRICRCEGEDGDPLFYPCGCTGSIKYIHQGCLQTWLEHSQKQYCELCNHEFKFIPVYEDDMPPELSVSDLFWGFYTFIYELIESWSRIVIVSICWGLIFPIVARWSWQLFFEDWLFPWEKENALRRLAWDCAQGCCIGLVVFCLALGLLALRDFIVANDIPIGDPLAPYDDRAGQEDEWQHVPPQNAPARPRPPPPVPPAHIGRGAGAEAELAPAHAQAIVAPEAEAHAQQPLAPAPAVDALPDYLAQDAYLDELLRRNPVHDLDPFNEDVLPPTPPTPDDDFAPAADHLDGLVEALVAAAADEEMANLANGQGGQQPAVAAAAALPANAHDDLDGMPPLEDADRFRDPDFDDELADWQINDEVPLEELFGLVGPLGHLFDNLVWITIFNGIAIFMFAFIPCVIGSAHVGLLTDWPVQSTAISAGVGYFYVIAAAFLYLSIKNPAQQSLTSRILTFFSVFIKVCTLLVCEVVICPLLSGWWLDVCSLELQNSTLRDHKAFFYSHTWTSSFLHWFVGMLFMHNFAGFVGVMRDVLRPGVLWFFRDPNDPAFHPLKQMLELPLATYSRRLLLITIMYGVLIIGLVWLPIKTVCSAFPSVLPYKVLLSHPLELLAFNFAVPIVQEYCDPSHYFLLGVEAWVRAIGGVLGITAYLLPAPTDPVPAEPTDPATLRPHGFPLRITMFFALGWLTCHVLVTGLMTVPVTLGRAIFASVPLDVHDMYAFGLGVGLLLLGLAVPMYLSLSNMLSGVLGLLRPLFLLDVVVHAVKIVGTASVMAGGLPMLVGVLIEHVIIIPLKCPLEMSPIYNLWQDWCIGIMVLKLVFDAEVEGPGGAIGNWRREIQGLKNDIARPGQMAAAPLVASMMVPMAILSLSLVLPFILTSDSFLRDYYGDKQTAVIYRWTYPVIIASILVQVLGGQATDLVDRMVVIVRDDKYLVGKRLVNNDRRKAK